MACEQIEYCGACEHYAECVAAGFTKCAVNGEEDDNGR